jgi:quinol monooxygenase YgiN
VADPSTVIKAIKADVDANEPGTLKYITTRGLDNDHQFVIFEEVR